MEAPFQRRSTIAQVAELAGVSVGTVSNVLNGKGRFSETTRRRVLWAASELHFVPNALIRSLQSGKTNTVGVFTWRLHLGGRRNVSLDLLRGISRGLSEGSLDALLYSRHPHEGEVEPSFFMDGRVDGIILAPGGLPKEGVAALAEAGVRAVLLYQTYVPEPLAAVTIDNSSGVAAAVQKLIQLGHRRIAFISPLYSDDFRERYETFRSTLEANGITADRRLAATDVPDHGEELDQAVLNLIRRADPPTGIIAGNDGIALRVLEVLRSAGVHVPADISVIGFDDSPEAQALRLSTVRQPAEEVGYQAARLLCAMLRGERLSSQRVHLPVQFVDRETTAPVG